MDNQEALRALERLIDNTTVKDFELTEQVISDFAEIAIYLTGPGYVRVPDGWKLVPRTPDAKMGQAACDVEYSANMNHEEPASFADIWFAMYDAAPILAATKETPND